MLENAQIYVLIKHMATLAEQLASVQAAITDIESKGQSITDGDQTKTNAMLATLYAREQRLLNRIDRAGRGRTTLAEF